MLGDERPCVCGSTNDVHEIRGEPLCVDCLHAAWLTGRNPTPGSGRLDLAKTNERREPVMVAPLIEEYEKAFIQLDGASSAIVSTIEATREHTSECADDQCGLCDAFRALLEHDFQELRKTVDSEKVRALRRALGNGYPS